MINLFKEINSNNKNILIEKFQKSKSTFEIWNKSLKIDLLLEKEEEIDLLLSKADYSANLNNTFKQKKNLSGILRTFRELRDILSDLESILDLLSDYEFLIIFENLLNDFHSKMNKLYLFVAKNSFLSKNHCYINFQSSTGGTESENLNYILFKEYLIMLDKKNISYKLIESDLQNSLLKNATVKVNEDYAYLFFKHEKGLHRFTRISPYGNGKLHTSFVHIDVYPYFESNVNEILDKKDIRFDTFRGSGAGGQHRNKTDSAVRLTHLPTNIVVKIEDERSQHMNRKKALSLLTSKVYEYNLSVSSDENDVSGKNSLVDWGSQIRSYTIDQNRVKDHRTDCLFNGNISNYFNSLYDYISNNNSIIIMNEYSVSS